MRSTKEIDNAIEQLRDAARGAFVAEDDRTAVVIVGMVKALEWVKGDNTPGGFGDMVRGLNRVDGANNN